MELDWCLAGPFVGLLCFFCLLQLACFVSYLWKKKTRHGASKISYHMLNEIDENYLVIVVATGHGKKCSLKDGHLRLKINIGENYFLNIDLSRALIHDDNVLTTGRRDTFYIGYPSHVKPNLDQIGLILTPYNDNDANWYGEYIYIRDSGGKRAFYILDHAFWAHNNTSEIVYIHQHHKSCCRIVLDCMYRGMLFLHLWFRAFRKDADAWQRIIPVALVLSIMVGLASMQIEVKEEEQENDPTIWDTVFSLLSSQNLVPFIIFFIGTTTFFWLLELVFRHVNDAKLPKCHCPDDCVKIIMQTWEDTEAGQERYTTEVPICTLTQQHMPGTAKCNVHSDASGFLDQAMEDVQRQLHDVGRGSPQANTDQAEKTESSVRLGIQDETTEIIVTKVHDGLKYQSKRALGLLARAFNKEFLVGPVVVPSNTSINTANEANAGRTTDATLYNTPKGNLFGSKPRKSPKRSTKKTKFKTSVTALSQDRPFRSYEEETPTKKGRLLDRVRNIKGGVLVQAPKPGKRQQSKIETKKQGSSDDQSAVHLDRSVTDFVNSIISGALDKMQNKILLEESRIDRAMKIIAKTTTQSAATNNPARQSPDMTNSREVKESRTAKSSTKSRATKHSDEPGTAALLIKELIKRTLAGIQTDSPTKKMSSRTLLARITQEIEKEKLHDYSLQYKDSLQDVMGIHLSEIVQDLSISIFTDLQEQGILSRKKKIEATKKAIQRRMSDSLCDFMSQENLQSSLYDFVFRSKILPREVSSEGSIPVCASQGSPQLSTFTDKHTASDSKLGEHKKSSLSTVASCISSSVTAFSSLRSQKVLESVCNELNRKMSEERIHRSQEHSKALHLVMSDPEVIPVDDKLHPLSRKASSSILLQDIQDKLTSIPVAELSEASQAALDHLGSHEQLHTLRSIIRNLLRDTVNAFSDKLVDDLVDILVKENKSCAHPNVTSDILSDLHAPKLSGDPSLQLSLMQYATSMVSEEIATLGCMEDTMYNLAMVIQYIDTVVTNAIIQAHTTLHHGLTHFTTFRLNESNNCNIDQESSQLRHTLISSIVATFTKHRESSGDFREMLVIELCGRRTGNYLVSQIVSLAHRYVAEVATSFDLESLATYSLQLNEQQHAAFINAENLQDVLAVNLEKAALVYGCQVIAQQLDDYYKHDDSLFSLELAASLMQKTNVTQEPVAKKYKKSGNALENLFDGCLSVEELFSVVEDLEDIRMGDYTVNFNQSHGPAEERMANSAALSEFNPLTPERKLEEDEKLLLEHENEDTLDIEKLIPQKYNHDRKYWLTKAYLSTNGTLLPSVVGTCFLVLLYLLIAACFGTLIWLLLQHKSYFSCTWAMFVALFVVLHVLIVDIIKSLTISLFLAFVMKDWTMIL